jgi:hypothetical protein
MTDFVVNISAEKRKLKQLKWNIHIQPNETSNELDYWILDNKGAMTKNTITKVTDQQEYQLKTCIDIINNILNAQTDDIKKHVQINLTSTSPFLINIIRDWIESWNKNNFENKPNVELLKQILALKKSCKLNASWAQPKN